MFSWRYTASSSLGQLIFLASVRKIACATAPQDEEKDHGQSGHNFEFQQGNKVVCTIAGSDLAKELQ
jgi:hypothetical protein